MKKNHVVLLIFIDLTLFVIICFLGYKIFRTKNTNVKGSYITKIDRKDIIFNSNSDLKNFYEPKPNTIKVWNPDWLGYETHNTINADSLNERFNYSIDKPNNVYRIITIGDSFTYGQYVETADNFSELLEDSLNKLSCGKITKYEVINLGVTGYDVEYTIERFIRRGIKYHPDLVIWLINGHNLTKLIDLNKDIEPTLWKKGYLQFDPISGRYPIADESNKIVREKYGKKFISDRHSNALKNLSEIYKGKLIIMTFNGSISSENRKIINNFININNNYIYYPNLYNIFQDESLVLIDGHPNNKGHLKIESEIYKFILEKQLINCEMIP